MIGEILALILFFLCGMFVMNFLHDFGPELALWLKVQNTRLRFHLATCRARINNRRRMG